MYQKKEIFQRCVEKLGSFWLTSPEEIYLHSLTIHLTEFCM